MFLSDDRNRSFLHFPCNNNCLFWKFYGSSSFKKWSHLQHPIGKYGKGEENSCWIKPGISLSFINSTCSARLYGGVWNAHELEAWFKWEHPGTLGVWCVNTEATSQETHKKSSVNMLIECHSHQITFILWSKRISVRLIRQPLLQRTLFSTNPWIPVILTC